jgi:hypothetical protein
MRGAGREADSNSSGRSGVSTCSTPGTLRCALRWNERRQEQGIGNPNAISPPWKRLIRWSAHVKDGVCGSGHGGAGATPWRGSAGRIGSVAAAVGRGGPERQGVVGRGGGGRGGADLRERLGLRLRSSDRSRSPGRARARWDRRRASGRCPGWPRRRSRGRAGAGFVPGEGRRGGRQADVAEDDVHGLGCGDEGEDTHLGTAAGAEPWERPRV